MTTEPLILKRASASRPADLRAVGAPISIKVGGGRQVISAPLCHVFAVLGVGCPHRNNGHSDNRAARGIDPMITLGSDREIGAAALAKARAGVPVATIPS
jgi:hypothetical protein